MRILLVVPDGVGVRNYLYSDFVKELEARGDEVMIYHKLSTGAISEIKSIQKNIAVIKEIPTYFESYKARILRESISYGRILYNKKVLKNETILSFWTKKPKNLKQRLLYTISESLGWMLSKSYKSLLAAENRFEKEVLKSKSIAYIEKDFDEFNPDYVINLHQRAPITAPVITVAKRRKLKTATVIFSWDNVPKGRLVSKYHHYFVWSQLMKDELALLYPEIVKNTIYITGTPQFEFYFKDEFKLSKESFFAKYGLDPNKKTVCFSANDLSSPYEELYFNDVCEQISEIDATDRPQILLRKCPVDKTTRFDEIIERFKHFVFPIDPDWRVGDQENDSFVNIYPAYNDITLLVNTVLHSDLVINLGSTMAHDFAVDDKPCMYLNYNPVAKSTFKVEEVYEFQHFRSLKDIDAVVRINAKDEIASKISAVLANPAKFAKDKRIWMERIVKHPLQENSRTLANSIE